MVKDNEIKTCKMTSVPFGAEDLHVREDSDENRDVGWTEKRAQENLEKEQRKNWS
jgi:hypothetical protein